MTFPSVIATRLERSFALFAELAESLPESALASRLPAIRSNSLGAQLWCVVGARESYARAIRAGRWLGFECSLDTVGAHRHHTVRGALATSADAVRAAMGELEDPHDARLGLLLDLLEHEAAHQGQIIRYLYGLELPIPPSWKARYALE